MASWNDNNDLSKDGFYRNNHIKFYFTYLVDSNELIVTEVEEPVKESLEEVVTPLDPATVRFQHCQQLIGEIREKQFGVGVELDPRGEAMLKTYREREGRSLDRLSKELYTKDSHFVLELIQNADDNEYFDENLQVDSDEKPTVAFIVESGKITVLNNEKGFMEKNVRALCDVGKSTKGIHRKGYIGKQIYIALSIFLSFNFTIMAL